MDKNERARTLLNIRKDGSVDFAKIFGVRKDGLDIDSLTDDQIAALADRLDGNRVDVGRQKHEVERMADLLIAANPAMTKQRALHHLLHDRSGAALVARLRKAINKRKDTKPMTWETLQKFVKSDGDYMLAFSKSVVADGNRMNLSEHQFVELATMTAQVVYPNDRPDKAFAKYFEAHEVVRRAHRVVKGLALIIPVVATDDDVGDPKNALAALEDLVEAQRAAHPELSKAQLFAKVYTDPANARLAQAERRQNRPRA
jgi:hypothetical protein